MATWMRAIAGVTFCSTLVMAAPVFAQGQSSGHPSGSAHQGAGRNSGSSGPVDRASPSPGGNAEAQQSSD